jgi:hypothetical protein
MRSPQGDVKEVNATADSLTPLMATGWHQAPRPAAAGPTPAPPTGPASVHTNSPQGEVKAVVAAAAPAQEKP